MLSVAVSWDLYLQTRSAVVLGNVGFVQVAPFLLFALPAGHFADRHDRRRIMIVTQILLMASSALLLTSARSVAQIYICLFLTALSRAFQAPARVASLPHVVSPDLLRNAITWNSSAQELATVSGPAIAGLLLASVDSRTVYGIQFACTALTLICYHFLRLRSKPESRDVMARRAPPPGEDVVEGIRFVWKDRLILSAISLDLFAVLFGGATALLPIYSVEILHTRRAKGLELAQGRAFARSHLHGAPAVAFAEREASWKNSAMGRGWFRGGHDCFRFFALAVAVAGNAGGNRRMRQR